MLSAAGAILEERARPPKDIETVRVPLLRQSAAGLEPAGALISLPAEFIDNVASAKCLLASEKSSPAMRSSVIVLDDSKTDLHSLWDEVVLVDFTSKAAKRTPSELRPRERPEQIIGLLKKQLDGSPDGVWLAAEIWSEHGIPFGIRMTIASRFFQQEVR